MTSILNHIDNRSDVTASCPRLPVFTARHRSGSCQPVRRFTVALVFFKKIARSDTPNPSTSPCVRLFVSCIFLARFSLDPAAGVDPSLAVVGGQARSLSRNITGPWHYDYFDAAYGMQPEWARDKLDKLDDGVRHAGGNANVGGMRSPLPPVLSRRERPKVLLEQGEPVFLYNGASVDVVGAEGGNRNCFTFGTAILP